MVSVKDLEKETKRLHKLSLPLLLERNGSALIVSDGIFEKSFEFKDFGKLRVTSIDNEGFVTFELLAAQQKTLVTTPTAPVHGTLGIGFVLIGSTTAKNLSGAVSRGSYEYYKRVADEYYYAVVKLGTRAKKIHLGSLQDASSQIRLIIQGMQNFGSDTWFDRKMLIEHLSIPSLHHGQKIKSTMDILVLEGYLERKEQQKLGKAYEQYKKTPKFLSIK